MKKLMIILFAVGIASAAAAQSVPTYPIQTPEIRMGGHFNSKTPGGGTRSTSDTAMKTWNGNSHSRLYTKLDTVDNTGFKVFRFTLKGDYSSVYTWMHATSISGTNTSCTAKLYVTSDSNYLLDPVEVYSVTVGSTNPIGKHLINSGKGWPYLHGYWIFQGSGTHSTSMYGGVDIR